MISVKDKETDTDIVEEMKAFIERKKVENIVLNKLLSKINEDQSGKNKK